MNVWYAITNLCKVVARKEVKKPLVSSGSFAHFSSCWEKWAAGGRPRLAGMKYLFHRDAKPLAPAREP